MHDRSKKNVFVLNLLLFLTFDLMLLGAGVRTMDAGLTCPDWPLCFGKVVPKYHFGVYLEFIHRAIAGLVGLLYMAFFVKVWRSPALRSIRILSVVGLLFLVAQIIMGGLTVLKLLEAYIVTMHLSLATVFLVCLYVMKNILSSEGDANKVVLSSQAGRRFSVLVLLSTFFVGVQIVLGGLVASTYSGLICIDFPTCNGEYFPTMVGPIAIQMIHRFGAYWLSFLLTLLFVSALFYAKVIGLKQFQRVFVARIFFVLGLQVFVGIMNLKFLMPPFLSVFHLFLALTILLSLIKLRFSYTVASRVRRHQVRPSG